jgi:cellulose synthase operon protein C
MTPGQYTSPRAPKNMRAQLTSNTFFASLKRSCVQLQSLVLMVIGVALLPQVVSAQVFPLPGYNQRSDREATIRKLSHDIHKVDHSIAATKKLIINTPDSPEVPNFYFRLAELYVERSRYTYLRLVEQNSSGESILEGDRALDVQISKQIAIETYDRILNNYPDYSRNDEIRFFRAHEFRELGDFETMLKAYRELIGKHPKSHWAIEARLIQGDHHFDKNDLLTAERFYREIINLPESHLHSMARYKLGWIKINQERFSEALALFEKAVSKASKDQKGSIGDAKSLNVEREALMALVWPFSEIKKAKNAASYFRKLATSKDLYLSALKKLANRYFVKTDYLSAAMLYREVVLYSSNLDENLEFVQRIYDSTRNFSKRNTERFINAAEDVDLFKRVLNQIESDWSRSEDSKKQIRAAFEIRMRDLSTRVHQWAKKKNSPKIHHQAALAYNKYLWHYPNNTHTSSILNNRAAVLSAAKLHQASAEQFEDIALPLEKSKSRKELIYQALAGFFKALELDANSRELDLVTPERLSHLDLLRCREALKQMGRYYAHHWPKNKHVPEIKFNIARMYHFQGELGKSSELFSAFVNEYPRHKDVGDAGRSAIDALYRLDDFSAIAKMGEAFSENEELADRAFRNYAAKMSQEARKRQVDLKVLVADPENFTETMVAEWEKHAGSKEGEDFLYAGFIKYKNEANLSGIYDFANRLLGAYPDSKNVEKVLTSTSNFALKAGDFDRAALLLEERAKRFPRSKTGRVALNNAIQLRKHLGHWDRAINLMKQGALQSSGSAKVNAFAQLMTLLAERKSWNNLNNVSTHAIKLYKSWRGAYFHLGLAQSRLGKTNLAIKTLLKADRLGSNSDFDRALNNAFNYELAIVHQHRFKAIAFNTKGDYESTLQKKLKLFEVIENYHIRVISGGAGAWAIKSLWNIALANQHLGEFIADAPAPKSLSNSDLKQYRQALHQEGKIFKKKAQETLSGCRQKARALTILDDHASRCMELSLAEPEEHSPRFSSDVGALQHVDNQAVATLHLQLAQNPENLANIATLSRTFISSGRYHHAIVLLSQALDKAPANPELSNTLGVAHAYLGNYQDAFDAFLVGHRGANAAATFNLVGLMKKFGYTKKASAYKKGNPKKIKTTRSIDIHPWSSTSEDSGS